MQGLRGGLSFLEKPYILLRSLAFLPSFPSYAKVKGKGRPPLKVYVRCSKVLRKEGGFKL